MLELDLCHIKTISNPSMGHIWTIYGSTTTPVAKIGLWTLSPRFDFPLSPRTIFPTGQRFLLPKHVTSGLGSLPVMSLPVPVMTSSLHQNEAKCAIWAPFTTQLHSGTLSKICKETFTRCAWFQTK